MKNPSECSLNIESCAPELSYSINIEQIQGEYCIKKIIASKEQSQKLAERFGLIKIEKFIATLNITRLSADRLVIVEADFLANIIQQCVITLDPIMAEIKGSYVCKYSDSSMQGYSETIDFDVMSEDPPEPIVDGQFDAGIILTEQLGLELDPFPRSHGKSIGQFSDFMSDKPVEHSSDSPFAILKNFK